MTSSDEPDVVKVLRQYRDALAAKEFEVMTDMGLRWLEIERSVQAELEALAGLMVEKASVDGTLTLQMLRKEERYWELLKKVQGEIRKYNEEYLVALVEAQKVAFAGMGVEAAEHAIRASYTTRMAPWFPVMNEKAVEAMAASLSAKAPLYALLKEAAPKAIEGLTKALISGIGRGLGIKDVAKEMANGMGLGLERSLLIARTEMMRAYRQGTLAEYRESKVVRGFKRLVKKSTACVACLMLDGEQYKVKEELEDHPNGKCQAVPLVRGMDDPAWETGRAYFEGLSEAEQRKLMGNQKFEAWKEGKFDLSAMAVKTSDPVWGSEPRVATVKELLEGG